MIFYALWVLHWPVLLIGVTFLRCVGIVSKNDIRATFDQMGRLTSDKELDEMMSEASGPINFTQFVTIFANKAGGMDEEETIVNAFTIFDDGDGTCTEEK